MEEEYPAIPTRALNEGAAIYWGDETKAKNEMHRGRTYSTKRQTPNFGKTWKKLLDFAEPFTSGKAPGESPEQYASDLSICIWRDLRGIAAYNPTDSQLEFSHAIRDRILQPQDLQSAGFFGKLTAVVGFGPASYLSRVLRRA